MPVSADRAALAGPTPARKAGFSPWKGKIPRDVDSPLEETGFDLVVPPSFSQLATQAERDDPDQRGGRARPFHGGTDGSNPVSSSGESGESPAARCPTSSGRCGATTPLWLVSSRMDTYSAAWALGPASDNIPIARL